MNAAEYYRRRAEQEQAKAKQPGTGRQRRLHEDLAAIFASKADEHRRDGATRSTGGAARDREFPSALRQRDVALGK